MARYHRRRSVKYRPYPRRKLSLSAKVSRFFASYRGKQAIGYTLLGLALIIFGPLSRPPIDLTNLDNGSGGPGWTIGAVQLDKPELQKGRVLSEANAYALRLVNRDRQLNGLSPSRRRPTPIRSRPTPCRRHAHPAIL